MAARRHPHWWGHAVLPELPLIGGGRTRIGRPNFRRTIPTPRLSMSMVIFTTMSMVIFTMVVCGWLASGNMHRHHEQRLEEQLNSHQPRMTCPASDIRVGDIVVLNTGGPLMAVRSLGNRRGEDGLALWLSCYWIYGDQTVEYVVDPATVELYMGPTTSGCRASIAPSDPQAAAELIAQTNCAGAPPQNSKAARREMATT